MVATNEAVLMIEPFALLLHVRDDRLQHRVDRGEVHPLDAVPRLDARDEDRVVVGRADAGVVERDVDRAVESFAERNMRPRRRRR